MASTLIVSMHLTVDFAFKFKVFDYLIKVSNLNIKWTSCINGEWYKM